MRARVARIAAAAVFVGGASLAVAGMAAAEEPDPCALHPLDAECLTVSLGLPGGSESPSGDATQASTDSNSSNGNNGNGNGNGNSEQPSDGSSPSVPTDTGSQGSTPPASTPPTQTVPPTSGTPTGSNPPSGDTGTPTGAPTTGTECSIANGDVNCGTERGSSGGSVGGSDPQRNYGGGAAGGNAAAADTPTATAAPGAAGTAGTTGGPTDVPELAATGQSENLTFIVIGGVAMAVGGLAFTIVPRKLSRREATAAA